MTVKRKPSNQYKNTEGEIPAIRWYNRRRLAWFAFYSLVGGTAIYWFFLPLWFTLFGMNLGWLSLIGESYSWFASTQTLIIAGYMGIEYIIKAKAPGIPNRTENESSSDEDGEDSDFDETVAEEEIYDPERK